jgi:hypothetical protein
MLMLDDVVVADVIADANVICFMSKPVVFLSPVSFSFLPHPSSFILLPFAP